MSGIVNKVKDMLHKDNADTAHSSHTTGTDHSSTTGHSTTGHSTINPADRNNDGKVDARDVTGGQHGATGGLSGHNTAGHNTTTGGLSGHNTTGHSTINPADRNNDGRVDARDLTGSNTTGGLAGHNTSHGTAGGLGSHSTTGHSTTGGLTGHSTTGHSTTHGTTSSGLTGALAQDASFAPTGEHNTRTADILDPHVSTGAHGHSSATTGGLGHGTTGSGLVGHGTANPIDRNNDGRVNARDLTGGGATGHSTTGGLGHSTAGGLGSSTTGGLGHTANPVDRNNDGRVDAHDLTGRGNTGHSTTGGLAGHSAAGGLGGHSAAGGLGHTANPADRNNDGRVDARDLTGQGHSTTGGLGHSSTGAGLGHSSTGAGGLGHSSTGAGLGHTANPIDRNNDGRVNAHDLTGSSNTGHHGPPVSGGLDHRAGESGDLPRALTEDVSRAQPAGFTEGHTGVSDSRHTSHGIPSHGSSTANTSTHGSSTTGTTGTNTAGKPSLKDKLNPKVDADRDGKAGIMD